MTLSHGELAHRLEQSISKHVSKHGEEMLLQHEDAAASVVGWLAYLRNSQATGTADKLLDGYHASLIEASGCLAIGLVRPAIFAIRAQVDILLAWLFFKDHRVEWDHTETTGKRYRLVSEVLKYLRTYDSRFENRLKLLRDNRTCGDENPYEFLSAHVHGQNTQTIPPLVEVSALVQDKPRCEECIGIQREISEYLNDILASRFSGQWADLPEDVKEGIKTRLDPAKLKELCCP